MSLSAQISDGRERRPPTTDGVKKQSDALSCGIKISAVHCLVLSQSKRVTDGRTDGQTDGQNYDFQDCDSIAAPAVKTNCMFGSISQAFRGTVRRRSKWPFRHTCLI